ncbi:nuclear transport factor 2 family protein [Pseudomonas sp. P115]|uniref:aromatic-ring-hydroxylating dioxygenase subunit beta n=1 Tax=Pseudomonas pisciculturae TaxID=2730413 RepID=UPI0013572B92|nr:nuclear transport factor 2 family protein [Pseudomonas pisciculturae]MBF6029797.1 nuclear transport factor 2 family protein [Pseudomonas pisciculturae]
MKTDQETFFALVALQADYSAALDAADWDRWPEFFTEQCVYKLQPRENHEQGWPLATLSFESKGMLKDRIYGIRETLFHDPYYQRHVVSLPRILGDDGTRIQVETNYAVFRTKPDEPSSVFNVGRYLDSVVRTPDGLRLESRLCVFDSEMIPNSIIYPI